MGFPFLFISLFYSSVSGRQRLTAHLCPSRPAVPKISWSFIWGRSGSRGWSLRHGRFPSSPSRSSSPPVSRQHAPAACPAPAVPLPGTGGCLWPRCQHGAACRPRDTAETGADPSPALLQSWKCSLLLSSSTSTHGKGRALAPGAPVPKSITKVILV